MIAASQPLRPVTFVSSTAINLGPSQVAEARNWHFYNGALGQKRSGSTAQTLTGDTHSGYNALFRYVPGQDETAAELFIVSSDATVKILRVAGGTAKANLTLADNVATRGWDVSFVVLNGKLYLAYDSTVNRLHVFDPNTGTTSIRRAGLAPFAAAATVANTGAGAYAATLRYYKTRSVEQQSSIVMRRSEGNASVSFTPSGAGTAARITRPTAVGEGETHWEVYGSTDDVTFYGPIATVAIATTTYDDSSTPSTWASTYDAEAVSGTYVPFPSVKYLATDGNRLLGYGVWETSAGDSLAPKNGRVFIGPVLDTTGTHDDERISNTTEVSGWIDITRNASSVDRGLSPKPLNGIFYVFQDRGIAMLVPTEDDTQPYARRVLSSQLGAVNQQSIVMGEDEGGRPCVYFLDPELGPYRIGVNGLQRIGKDVQDIWDTVNLGATGQVAWGLYNKPLNVVLWWVSTGSSNDPDTALCFDVTNGQMRDFDGIREGWTVWDGTFATGRCGVMFASSMGASMGRKLVPFVGVNGTSKLLRYDTSVSQDDSTSFQGYLKSGAFSGGVWPKSKRAIRSYLLASAQSGVSITQTWIRNFGDETNRTDHVSLTPEGSETNVLRRFDAPELQDAGVFQVQLGDAAAANSAFVLERWWAQIEEQELR